MLVVTTDNVPGYEVDAIFGEVVGTTARPFNTFNEGVRQLIGGINPRMPDALAKWRQDAVAHMVEVARRLGANAVIGMRFDHRPVSAAWIEICAYGTAVRIRAMDGDAPFIAT